MLNDISDFIGNSSPTLFPNCFGMEINVKYIKWPMCFEQKAEKNLSSLLN